MSQLCARPPGKAHAKPPTHSLSSSPATEAAADYQITEPYWIGREPKGIRAATPVVMLQPGHAEAAEGDDDAQSEDAAISDEGYGRPNASGPYPDPKPKNPCA